MFGAAAAELHIAERNVIHREETAGGAELRRHIGDGCPVRQRQIGQPIAVKLDELADHAMLTQHLSHRQHQVSGGNALAELAGQLEADHVRDQHRHRLAQHRRFRFDAADAPAENAQAVDHGGVGIGAHQRIRISHAAAAFVAVPDRLAEVFEVDLVTDAGARRHHAEAVEGFLPPAQEGVALVVALHFDTHVVFEGVIVAKFIDGNRVVNHQIHRRQRIHLVDVAAQSPYRFAHRGQIHHRRNAGKILHQHARRTIGDLTVSMAGLQPGDDGLEVVNLHGIAIHMAQQVLQQHFH